MWHTCRFFRLLYRANLAQGAETLCRDCCLVSLSEQICCLSALCSPCSSAATPKHGLSKPHGEILAQAYAVKQAGKHVPGHLLAALLLFQSPGHGCRGGCVAQALQQEEFALVASSTTPIIVDPEDTDAEAEVLGVPIVASTTLYLVCALCTLPTNGARWPNFLLWQLHGPALC